MKSWVLPSRSCSFVALARREKDESVFSSIKQVSGLRMIMMCEFSLPKKATCQLSRGRRVGGIYFIAVNVGGNLPRCRAYNTAYYANKHENKT